MSDARRRSVLAVAALGAVAVDVVTKVGAVTWLDAGPVRLGPALTLRLVHNSGIAFGVAAGAPAPLVIGVTALVAATIAGLAWRGALGPALPAGLIVGGAVANVADRALGGSVVDFLDVGRWPTFNVADVLLIAGIALLVLAPQRSDSDAAPRRPVVEPSGT